MTSIDSPRSNVSPTAGEPIATPLTAGARPSTLWFVLSEIAFVPSARFAVELSAVVVIVAPLRSSPLAGTVMPFVSRSVDTTAYLNCMVVFGESLSNDAKRLNDPISSLIRGVPPEMFTVTCWSNTTETTISSPLVKVSLHSGSDIVTLLTVAWAALSATDPPSTARANAAIGRAPTPRPREGRRTRGARAVRPSGEAPDGVTALQTGGGGGRPAAEKSHAHHAHMVARNPMARQGAVLLPRQVAASDRTARRDALDIDVTRLGIRLMGRRCGSRIPNVMSEPSATPNTATGIDRDHRRLPS